VQAAIKQRYLHLHNSLAGARSGDAAVDAGRIKQDDHVQQQVVTQEQQLLQDQLDSDKLRVSGYRGGLPAPVTAAALAHQARGAAVALVRFGDSIPAARKQQLEQVIAQFMGR
jgi:hypothetical protein